MRENQDPVRAGLPEAVRLDLDFDTARLTADLETLSRHTWRLQTTYSSDGALSPAAVDWRVLPLRSVGGDPDRTDSGGPGLHEHEPTPWLERTPYLARVLASIPAQLRSARLMALAPGALGADHEDTKHAVAWGTARLHIPITTNPAALLYIDGYTHHWTPGSVWLGNFSRRHHVENRGDQTRVHLVIDAMPGKALFELIPDDVRAAADPACILFCREPVPLPADLAASRPYQFPLPASFADWEEHEGNFLRPQPTLSARVTLGGGRAAPVLTLDGEPAFRLVHLGGGEFRLAGWTDERTVQLVDGEHGPQVILRTRAANRQLQLTVAAHRV